MQALVSRRIATPEGIRPGCVLFENGTIVAVQDRPSPEHVDWLDLGDLYVLPGLVDSHVHINEPGRTEWEGFATASRAAAAGGFTCLVDMPLNCIPATTTADALERKRVAAAGESHVDYAFWGGVVQGNCGEIGGLIEAGVAGFKAFLIDSGIQEFSAVSEADLRLAMPLIAASGLPLLVHCELPEAMDAAARNISAQPSPWRDYASYLQSRPPEAETQAIELMIRMCREYRCRVHIVHLSAAEALPAIRRARDERLPLTVETCPHYLYFAAEQIPGGATQYKCAPPIRVAANREKLWQALREGAIDLVATDHSPCAPVLKCCEEGDFRKAWGGIASLSLALPLMWTSARERGCEVTDLVQWMAERPAELAGLSSRKGRIAPGCDADFVVFDPDAEWTVQPEDLHFRHAVCPYLGEALRGRVKTTILRGKPVFQDGRFAPDPRGRECRLSAWNSAW